MPASIAIVGSGVMGRVLTLEMSRRGWSVTLFDRDDERGTRSCTWASAGMISPGSELETAERELALLGNLSLDLWPGLLAQFPAPVYFHRTGSLIVAHPVDHGELDRLGARLKAAAPSTDFMREVDAGQIEELEPELSGTFRRGLFLPGEAHIDSREALRAMGDLLKQRGCTWRTGVEVGRVSAREVHVAGRAERFDWVADCRGMGARDDLKELRGVRGELLYVSAPEVGLTRPVRLMHPRYKVYVVPRADHVYVIGATAIESEDVNPVTVRSMLELLSAAYAVHSGFAEAHILEAVVGCRPAFPDNRPRILCSDGLVRINGLYRHGWLIAPALARFACHYLEEGEAPAGAAAILREEAA